MEEKNLSRSANLFFTAVFAWTSVCLPAAAEILSDECTLDEVIFGEQLLGPAITEDDCRGRVTVFFTWGIT